MITCVRTYLRHWTRNERGATLAEYGLVVALIAVVAIGVLGSVGEGVSAKFKTIAEALKK